MLNIELQELGQGYNATVYDIQGREVLQQQLTASLTQLNVNALGNGVYFLRLASTENLVNIRFVVQH